MSTGCRVATVEASSLEEHVRPLHLDSHLSITLSSYLLTLTDSPPNKLERARALRACKYPKAAHSYTATVLVVAQAVIAAVRRHLIYFSLWQHIVLALRYCPLLDKRSSHTNKQILRSIAMSAGLDIAAGIAGLITLSDIVITRTYKTIKACKNASKESRALLKHIQALLGVLRGVQSLADEAASGSLESCIPAEEVLDCKATLEALRDHLVAADPSDARVSTLTKWKRTVQWPISADETQEVLADLDRYMTIFDVSLSVEILNNVLIDANQTKSIVSTVERTAREVEEIRKSMEFVTTVLLDQQRRSVLTFFHALDAADHHLANTQKRLHDTRPGRTADPALKHWLTLSSPGLVIQGNSDTRVTALAGALIDEAKHRAHPQSGLAYYYCRPGQTLQTLLACLAAQLAQQNQACFELLYRTFDERLGQSLPNRRELSALVRQCVGCFDHMRIILDGVEECENLGGFTTALASLVSRGKTSLLFLTSRPVPGSVVVRHGFDVLRIYDCYGLVTPMRSIYYPVLAEANELGLDDW